MSEPATTQPATPRLSPKEGFQNLTAYANDWRGISRSDITHTALTYALAEYASQKPSSEQMKGALDFIDIILHLAEPKGEARGAFPDKRLTPPIEVMPRREEKK